MSATAIGDVVKIVAGLVQLAGSPTGQQLLTKIFLKAGLTEEGVNAHVAALKDSPPPRQRSSNGLGCGPRLPILLLRPPNQIPGAGSGWGLFNRTGNANETAVTVFTP